MALGTLLTVHWIMRDRDLEEVVSRQPAWVVGAIVGLMATGVILAQGEGSAFIYFQF